MHARLLALALLAPVAAAPLARAQAPRGLSVQDAIDARQVTDAALSHDGALAAWVLDVPRAASEPNGPSWQRLYVGGAAPAARPRPARLFLGGDAQVSAPAFSPDDRFVAFLAKRGTQKHPQVWAIPVDGGEARPVTQHAAPIAAFAWLADGRIAFIAEAPRTKREDALADKDYAPRLIEEQLRERAVWLAPFTFEGEPQEAARLTVGVSVWQLDAAPRGRTLALGASLRPLVDEMYMAQDLYLVEAPAPGAPVAAVAPQRIVDVPGKLGPLRLSPDGGRLAYVAAASLEDHAPSTAFVYDRALAADPRASRRVSPEGFEGHVTAVGWLDDQTLTYAADEGVRTTWSRVALGDPAAKRTVLLDGAKTGLVADLPRTSPATRRALFVAHSPSHPRELFAWERGALTRLTDSNPGLADRAFGPQEVFRWTARHGPPRDALLLRPPPSAAPAGARPPLIVAVHGGPESHVAHGWVSGYFMLGQVAAQAGYAVFYPNYRGSTGRGVAFAASAYGDPAGREFDDIVDGIAALTGQDGLADPARVAVIGGSYGGYAANWFATRHSALVRAAVSFVGVSDLVSKRLVTDIPYEDQHVHIGAPLEASWAQMLDRSPIRWAAESRTALLLLHGDADPRVPPAQSQEMYRALKMLGHPAVRLVFYPGEGHGNRKRSYRLDAAQRTLAWLDWYVRDAKPLSGGMPPDDLSAGYGLDLPAAPAEAPPAPAPAP